MPCLFFRRDIWIRIAEVYILSHVMPNHISELLTHLGKSSRVHLCKYQKERILTSVYLVLELFQRLTTCQCSIRREDPMSNNICLLKFVLAGTWIGICCSDDDLIFQKATPDAVFGLVACLNRMGTCTRQVGAKLDRLAVQKTDLFCIRYFVPVLPGMVIDLCRAPLRSPLFEQVKHYCSPSLRMTLNIIFQPDSVLLFLVCGHIRKKW